MQPTIRPPGNRVFIKRDEYSNLTPGGIIIRPDTHKDIPDTGIVLAVGKDVREDIEPGDKVWVGKFAGHETTLDGEKFCYVFNEGDILQVGKDDGKREVSF